LAAAIVSARTVLADPRKPRVRQRRDAGVRDVVQADVAGFGEQDGADADVQVLDAGAALAEVRERIGEGGPAADFEQDF
jgi:electron transfer flavoprotein alpha/beta subunit